MNNSKRYMYANAENQATPLFQVTPAKNCRMFPYLWTEDCARMYSGTERNPYICRSQGPVDSSQKYNGLPVSFKYSLSGENCKITKDDEPQVL
jgi:hypothetical protein